MKIPIHSAAFLFLTLSSCLIHADSLLSVEERMCAVGDGEACANAGYSYDVGKNIAINKKKALDFYLRACTLNNVAGCTNLASMYQHAEDTKTNQTLAGSYYAKGCELGGGQACYGLASMYERGEGVEKDKNATARLLYDACSGGHGKSCVNLGYMYEIGDHVEKDPEKSFAYFKIACELGNMAGCSNLGAKYQHGSGIAKDYVRAVELYEKACSGGYQLGCSNLGSMYFRGFGVAKDLKKASEFFKSACENDNKVACDNLKIAVESDVDVTGSRQRIIRSLLRDALTPEIIAILKRIQDLEAEEPIGKILKFNIRYGGILNKEKYRSAISRTFVDCRMRIDTFVTLPLGHDQEQDYLFVIDEELDEGTSKRSLIGTRGANEGMKKEFSIEKLQSLVKLHSVTKFKRSDGQLEVLLPTGLDVALPGKTVTFVEEEYLFLRNLEKEVPSFSYVAFSDESDDHLRKIEVNLAKLESYDTLDLYEVHQTSKGVIDGVETVLATHIFIATKDFISLVGYSESRSDTYLWYAEGLDFDDGVVSCSSHHHND